MNIPNLPREKITLPDGSLHPTWQNFFTQLVTEMQNKVSEEGFVIPSINATQFPVLDNSNNISRIIYNSNTSQMMINNSGTYKAIMTF